MLELTVTVPVFTEVVADIVLDPVTAVNTIGSPAVIPVTLPSEIKLVVADVAEATVVVAVELILDVLTEIWLLEETTVVI